MKSVRKVHEKCMKSVTTKDHLQGIVTLCLHSLALLNSFKLLVLANSLIMLPTHRWKQQYPLSHKY